MAAPTDGDVVSWWGLVKEGFLTTHQHVDATVERETGLAPAQAEVLLRLVRTPGHRLPMSRIAQQIALSSGGFSKVADKLIEQELMVRVRNPADRRMIFAELTPAGVRRGRRVERITAAVLRERVVAVVGAATLERIGGELRRLRDAN